MLFTNSNLSPEESDKLIEDMVEKNFIDNKELKKIYNLDFSTNFNEAFDKYYTINDDFRSFYDLNKDFLVEYTLMSRNFSAGDKVRTTFKGKTFTGEVVQKINSFFGPSLYIKTDQRVGYESDDLFDGFGLNAPVSDARETIYFKSEPSQGDKKYEILTRPTTKKELVAKWIELSTLPF